MRAEEGNSVLVSCASSDAMCAAAQVLWARLLHMNGADMEEIRKAEPDMEDVLIYLSSGNREQAKRDATALLSEVFAE